MNRLRCDGPGAGAACSGSAVLGDWNFIPPPSMYDARLLGDSRNTGVPGGTGDVARAVSVFPVLRLGSAPVSGTVLMMSSSPVSQSRGSARLGVATGAGNAAAPVPRRSADSGEPVSGLSNMKDLVFVELRYFLDSGGRPLK
jgi:hypothetical protein